MSPELLLLLFAFAVPGAAFVEAWDLACHRKDRPIASLLGWGLLLSLVPYTLLQGIGCIRLGRLIGPTGLDLGLMLLTHNLVLFGGLCLAGGALGYTLGRWQPSFLVRMLGFSFKHTVWGEMFEIARDRGAQLTIRTKSGWTWRGFLRLAPQAYRGDDFVALQRAHVTHDTWEGWVEQPFPTALILISDIEHIQMKGVEDYGKNQPISAQDGRADRRQLSLFTEGQPPAVPQHTGAAGGPDAAPEAEAQRPEEVTLKS